MRKAIVLLFVTVLAAWPVAQKTNERVLWNQQFQPFRLVGNVYYVGVAGLSSFLIVTPEGSILLDAALRESAPLIARSITELGFGLRDVKYLLNSHVHFDHAGGFAELKRVTGATMVASRPDGKWLQVGSSDGRDLPPVAVDRLVDDGDTVALGGTVLTAHMTPGHTAGCTTWTMTTTEDGKPQRVIFYCGTSVVGPLVGNARYPGIVEDYEYSFRRLRAMSADVFFEGHPFRWKMEEKRRRLKAGAPNPFVDPAELSRFVHESEQQFRNELARQRSER